MELSVIIVSFRVRDYLRECLYSAEAALKEIDSEIIVVDNNSGDGSVDMIDNEFPRIRLIVNELNAGFSAANNQAIRLSKGRFILLLNPDTIVEPDSFSKCLLFMNEKPDAGAIGVRMVNGDGEFLPESKRAFPTPWTAFFKSFGLSYLFPRSAIISRYYLPLIDSFETSVTEVISGAYMFIRREALDKSGLLDEDFFMYGEDIDLSYRLQQTGFRNYYYPAITIVHLKGKSTPRNSYNDILQFYHAMQVYIRKSVRDGRHSRLLLIIMPVIRFREGLALLNRLLKLTFHR